MTAHTMTDEALRDHWGFTRPEWDNLTPVQRERYRGLTVPPPSYQGTARLDTPEVRALRVKADAQITNLQNAVRNGALGHALTLRAGTAAEAVRNLSRALIAAQLEPVTSTADDGVVRCGICGGFHAYGPGSTEAMHRHIEATHPAHLEGNVA